MASLSPAALPKSPPPAHQSPQGSAAERNLLGLWALLIGGWSSLTAVMADSGGGLRARAVTLLVLVSVVGYHLVRPYVPRPTGPAAMVTGVLVGLVVGWLVASTVILVGPSLIIPLGVAVAAVVALAWLVRSVRQASSIIGQTVAELAATAPTGPGSDPDWRTRV